MVWPKHSGPAFKVVLFHRSGHFGRKDRNVSFHLTKLLFPVLLPCILVTRTITKRAVAWVGSMQPECTDPKGSQISEILNRNFRWMESALGFLGSIFAKESSLARAKYVRWTVEFGGKRLRIRRLRKQGDRCWPLVGHKIIVLCHITDKPSKKSWDWFVRSSIPEALSPVLENFCRRFSWLNWPTLGLRGCFYQSNKNNLYKCPRTYFS